MKNKIVAGLLAFFLGWAGIHRFYLGDIGKGIAYALFFWTGIPFIIGFIDFIVFLAMDDDVFDAKYNKGLAPRNNVYHRNQQNQQNQRPQFNRQQTSYEGQPSYNKYEPQYEQPKPKAQPKQEKRTQSNPYKDEGTRLYKEYDFKGAIKNYQQSLRIHPNDPIIHFNLACLYSLMEEPPHSYMHLSKAVESGFVMYDKIKSHDHLAYLRTQPDFDTFVANGYKIGNAPAQLAPRAEDEIDLMSDEIIQKLEKLGELRDKGILTDIEFQKQKVKLLRKR
jgi:TM2 domain-containing membrane protein YozV